MHRTDKFKIFAILLLIAAFLAAAVSAEAQPEEVAAPRILAEVVNETVHIGDRIELNVTAESGKNLEFIFPDTPEDLGEFAFFGAEDIKRGRREGRVYVLGIYTTGTHVIPPIEVMYRAKGEEEWKSAESNSYPLVIESLLKPGDYDIRDLKGVASYGKGPVSILVFVLSIAGAILLVWALWRRKQELSAREALRPRLPHEIAYDELKALKEEDLPGKGLVKEYYSRLSRIVREYVENRFELRAPEMTTEEFMAAAKIAPELNDGQKELLSVFLMHCDMVKFAKYGPTSLEMMDSYKSAEHFVDETKALNGEAAE